MRFDAKQVIFDEAILFDEEVLFTDLRIDRKTVPLDFYVFELRHEDEDDMAPRELAEDIRVNFYGTVIARKTERMKKAFKDIPVILKDEDFGLGDDCLTLDEWIFKAETE